METEYKQILYFGPWDHVQATTYFPLCKSFIYIDTQPATEVDKYHELLYRPKFIEQITNKFKKYNFEVISIISINNINNDIPLYANPHLFIFYNMLTKQKIKYYISTNIKYFMNDELKKDIMDSDVLYVAGYIPEECLLQYLNKKITFVGDNNSIYEFNNNIMSHLYYFDSFYIIYRNKTDEFIKINKVSEIKSIN